ncbi:hypothetical protein LEP3755_44630 [Leptolyngbya sp. NIES-3755]|nr:hypothetical protein LEP3755_44630 [Leptolyngbya sp. NIES-3755]
MANAMLIQVDPKLGLQAASSGCSMQSPPVLPPQAETSEQQNTTTL